MPPPRSTHARDGGWARFDDLVSGAALRCPPARTVLTATRPADVRPALAAVDAATAAGSWAFGFVAYEAAHGLDPALPARAAPDGLPLVWFGLCDAPVAVPTVAAPEPARRSVPWTLDWDDATHARAVQRVRAAIGAGDTYQVNLTDRLRARDIGDPAALYARLAHAQQAAHNSYLDLGSQVIASASPELFFEWRGDTIRTRPMKGTASRGHPPAEDRRRAAELLSSPKERAENLMIVDLLRNDLSRIAVPGTVAVPELFTVEAYPTVWQLTSEITARKAPHVGLLELFGALFPCGSVTGAPKRSTMQLIAELEPTARGVYCGAIGLIGPPEAAVRARFSVAIRTAVLDRATGAAVYGAGGGITWDSTPAAERAELLAKTAVLGSDLRS